MTPVMTLLARESQNELLTADRGPQMMVLIWILTAASTITVILRAISQVVRAKVGWDDFFMVFALICFFGWSICVTIFCVNGGEQHIQAVMLKGPDVAAKVQLLNWTGQVFGILGVGAGKVSIAALLLAILRNTQRNWKVWYLWIVCIVLVVGVSVSCSILTFAQCRPAAALWDRRVKGTCLDPKIMANYGTFTGAFFTFVDASLALMPSLIFFRLQINRTEKIQLCLIFSLNILTSICSGVKTSYLSHLADRQDFTWATYDIFAWVTAEFFLVIFSGTLPALKPLVDLIWPGHRNTSSKTPYRWESSKKNTKSSKSSRWEDQMELTQREGDCSSSHRQFVTPTGNEVENASEDRHEQRGKELF